jgi:fucose permease
MNAAFVLAGLATMLLGPILPILIHRWSLTDSEAGLLLLAQFTGATLGGATVSRRLPQAFLLGLACAAAGFLVFGLLAAGFGVGRIIASVNIVAGNRYTSQRGSALSRLNVAFSFGMLLSPLLAAQLTARVPLPRLLAGFAALFLVAACVLFTQLRSARVQPEETAIATQPIVNPIFLLFVAILFLYGGLETCLGGWFTTYAFRYGQTSLLLSQYIMVLLLCGLTSGRALAAVLLKTLREATLLRIALACSIASATALAAACTAPAIAGLAILLGLCLAPIFPASFALYLANRPTARQAGLVLAASGLGAAAIPWLMGVVSTHSGSLRVALALPIAAAALLLLLSVPSARASISTASSGV